MQSKSLRNIVFSDESMIEFQRRRFKVFNIKGYDVKRKVLSTKYKFMVFGCISLKGKLFFEILQENQTGEVYREIMDRAIESINKIHKRKWIFQQDGAGPHTSIETIKYFNSINMKLLKHPPSSPGNILNFYKIRS
jgi:hypothetical protein